MTGPETHQRCGGHASLGGDVRTVLLGALDRLAPVLDGTTTFGATTFGATTDGPGTPSSCASCPICAVLAALRGERPELFVRLAEQATGLIAVLRAALEEDAPPAPAPAPSAPSRRVQRIPVERVAAS